MPLTFLLLTGACCLLYAHRAGAQLIEPSRGLRGDIEERSVLNVFSEPPGMAVRVDDHVIGQTPLFSAKIAPGAHLLRIGDSEREVHLPAGKTTTMSWFKGSFMELPEAAQTPQDIKKALQPSQQIPQREEKPVGQEKAYEGDPYYWPMNPRGPIN